MLKKPSHYECTTPRLLHEILGKMVNAINANSALLAPVKANIEARAKAKADREAKAKAKAEEKAKAEAEAKAKAEAEEKAEAEAKAKREAKAITEAGEPTIVTPKSVEE